MTEPEQRLERIETLLAIREQWPKATDYNVVNANRVNVLDAQHNVLATTTTANLEALKIERHARLETMRSKYLTIPASIMLWQVMKWIVLASIIALAAYLIWRFF